jgi:hypothetical protein
MRWILAVPAAVLIAGCSSAATSTTAQSTPAAMPAGCVAALAVLPSSAPANATQAAADVNALGGRKGTTLDAMLDKVAADASGIGLALDTGSGDVTSAVAAFKADAAAVRSYCG